jgi:dTDP-4-amino-4,6-dideoxygalactose transaminase
MKVDFYMHQLGPADAEAVAAVLATPFLTTGNVARAVETQLSSYFSLPYAVLVNNWTNGAIAVLLAMEIGPGDEVIVPAMTFIASANVVELAGAKVVFADVDPATLLLTPELAARHVTHRTRAIIPVHLYGQMCDIPGLRAMLKGHPAASQHIAIIEDCAHCFEGEREGMKPGTASDVAIFSFYATKNVTCGEGGAIVTSDAELYERILATRMHGMSAIAVDRFAGGRYNHWDMKRLGTKANLPDLLAALLPRQIATVDERLPPRRAIADRYRRAFAEGPLRLVTQLPYCKSAEHIFPIGVANGARDAAIIALNAAGISVTVNYRSVPESSFYKSRYPGASATCRIAHDWGEETLTLPLFIAFSHEEQDYVIKIVRERVYPLARSMR